MLFVNAFVLQVAVLAILVQSFQVHDETEAKVLSQALKKVVEKIVAPINQTVNFITCHGAEHRLSNLMTHLIKDLNNTMTFTSEIRPEIQEAYDNIEKTRGDKTIKYSTPTTSIIICDKRLKVMKNSSGNHLMFIDDMTLIAYNQEYGLSGVKLLKGKISSVAIGYGIVYCTFLSKTIQLKLKQILH